MFRSLSSRFLHRCSLCWKYRKIYFQSISRERHSSRHLAWRNPLACEAKLISAQGRRFRCKFEDVEMKDQEHGCRIGSAASLSAPRFLRDLRFIIQRHSQASFRRFCFHFIRAKLITWHDQTNSQRLLAIISFIKQLETLINRAANNLNPAHSINVWWKDFVFKFNNLIFTLLRVLLFRKWTVKASHSVLLVKFIWRSFVANGAVSEMWYDLFCWCWSYGIFMIHQRSRGV